MNQQMDELKNNYLLKKGFFDRIYLTDEENESIKQMKYKEKKLYMSRNNIQLDVESNENYGKYYKIKYWDISQEELLFLTNLDNNLQLDKIKSYILIIIVMFVFFALFLFYR